MQITSIRKQLRNPERVSIFVDRKYGFSLNLGQLLDEKVSIGLEIDASRLKKLKKISDDGRLKDRALAWVLNRPHSVREFQDYLRKNKTDPDFAKDLTNQFIDKKYLDDKVYTKWLVELRTRKGKSNRAIKAELSQKGVAREIAEEVLSEDIRDERTRIKQLMVKKRLASRYAKDPQKLVQYLTRQGFSYDLIKEVVSSKRLN
jgi:SOS response regulatory protein OraA/RecX